MIIEAYRELITFPVLPFLRYAPIAEQDALLFIVIEKCNLQLNLTSTFSTIKSQQQTTNPAELVLVGNPNEAESRSTCEILRKLLQVRMQNAGVVTVLTRQESIPHLRAVCYVIVVLTKGLLLDSAFGDILLAFEDAGGFEFVTALADKNFEFPVPSFYTKLQQDDKRGARLTSSFR